MKMHLINETKKEIKKILALLKSHKFWNGQKKFYFYYI